MKTRNWQVLSAALAALLLVTGYDAVSYAATGDSLILGAVNKAGHTTTIERATKGPALKLETKPGSPPLAVTSGRRVARLNADRLDGLDAAELASRVRAFTAADLGVPYASQTWTLDVAPGVYRVDVNGMFVPVEASSPTTVFCAVESYLLPSYIDTRVELGVTAPFMGSPANEAEVSGSKVVRVSSKRAYFLDCAVDTGQYFLSGFNPLSVQFTPVTSLASGGTLEPFTP